MRSPNAVQKEGNTSEKMDERRGHIIVLVLSLCCFTLGCAQQFILGVPQEVADSCGVALADISYMQLAFGVFNAIGTPIVLTFSERMGQKRQLIIGMSFMACGMIMTALLSNFVLLVIARGIMGIGNGTFVAVAYAVAAKVSQPGQHATAMANVALGFSAATVLAMPIARSTQDLISWHQGYGILSILAIISIIIVAIKVPEVGFASKKNASFQERIAPLEHRPVIFAVLATFFTFMSMSTTYTYITPLLEEILPDVSLVGFALLILGAVSILGTKIGGLASDKLGITRSLIGVLAVQSIVLAVTGASISITALSFIPLCLWMLTTWSFLPSENLFLTEVAPDSPGLAVGLSNSGVQFGNAIGAVVAGLVVAYATVEVVAWFSLIFTLIALIFEINAIRRGRRALAQFNS
jgi:DHA1 family putative efflux transporter-like MFS transporter